MVLGDPQEFRLGVFQDFRAEHRVVLHFLELRGSQLSGFHQDRIGDAQLADVVHGRGVTDAFHLGVGKPQPLGQDGRVAAHAMDVHGRVVVLVFGRDRQAEDGIQVGVLQFLGEHGVLDGDGRLGGQGQHQVLEVLLERNDGLALVGVDELDDPHHVAQASFMGTMSMLLVR